MVNTQKRIKKQEKVCGRAENSRMIDVVTGESDQVTRHLETPITLTHKLLPFRPRSKDKCILFFVVEVDRIIIAGIKLRHLVARYKQVFALIRHPMVQIAFDF